VVSAQWYVGYDIHLQTKKEPAVADSSADTAYFVRIDSLRGCVVSGLDRLDVRAADAEQIADVLLDLELRGHATVSTCSISSSAPIAAVG